MVEGYDAALFDLDGVLYLGDQPVPYAAEGVAVAREGGLRIAFVTNNASRAPRAVAAHLTELGVPAEPGDVVTSGQAAARVVAEALPTGAAVLVLGAEPLADELRAVGLAPVRSREQAGPDGVRAVVQGLDRSTSMADLAEAAICLHGGALWVAANTDSTLPSPDGLLPGNGAFVQVLRTVTGLEPRVAGKPDPALHHLSVGRIGAQRPLVVGDRLETDVLGAVRGDADSLLVLTGVTDLELLCSAPRGQRPTYVGADLRALDRPQPEVTIEGETARCGPARVRYTGREYVVEAGDGEPALRARVALAWEQADRTG